MPKRAYTVSGFNTYSMNAYGAKVSSKATLTSNYTFNGWYTAESGGSRVINDSSTPAYIASVSGYTDGNGRWKRDEATTLYAQWTPVAVTLPTITRSGYTCGWSTSFYNSSIMYASGTEFIPTANTTLYGVCQTGSSTSSYTVNVVVQNGTVDSASKTVNSGSNGSFTLTPSAGYSSPSVSCTNSQRGYISGSTLTVYNVTNNTTCTVTYSSSDYTITLTNTDATTTGTTSVTAAYNSSTISPSTITLPKRSYTVSGFGTADSRNSTGASISSTSTLTSTYTFNGWYTKTSGGSKVINNSSTPAYVASVSGYTDSSSRWIKEGGETLYAQWSSQSVTLPTITKSGYTCGWTTSETGTTVSYASGATYTPTENTPMYAVCKSNTTTYTVNVVVQNGTVSPSSRDIESGSNGTFTISPSSGYDSPTVSCTNSQSASISGNTLTVSNVTSATTCTVKYTSSDVGVTTLYEDGTFIINEKSANRSANTAAHGAVTNEYEALSDTQSYSFSDYNNVLWYNEKDSITAVELGQTIRPTNTAYWFYNCKNMTAGDFTNLITSQGTAMNHMFWNAGYSATTFNIGDLSNWDTSSVTNMQQMFWYAGYSATTWSIGDLSNWNTSSVTNMSGMFGNASYKTTTFDIGDLSGWDTSSVTSMYSMFEYAGYRAKTFDIGNLSNWDTSSVTNMNRMFASAGYSATTFSIGDLSGWDTSSVTNMASMFNKAGYSATWSLDCTSWNVNKVTSYSSFNAGVTSKVTAPTWVN